jgi:hypothetical protein
MSNELLVVAAAVGLGVLGIVFVRFMMLDHLSTTIRKRPDGSKRRTGEREVGR